MITESVVDLSRLQFAATALYHFLFVPLTLGMTFMLAIMESCYVMTGKQVYKDMTQFWGKLFGINFALGVATGLTMEFEFGTNWAYYSHYVGDIFGAPLAIEGLMAFFLESTFIGLFFFGWDKMSKPKHLMCTWLVALGSNLSALWILVANGWMQNPVGSEFNFDTMRMEMSSWAEVFLNPVAQAKFVHTVSAGYCTGAMFVLSISAYYLLKGRDVAFARRSFAIASAFGTAAVFSVILLGDESGYEMGAVQKAKLAAVEAEWETTEAPASFNLIAFPDQEEQTNHAAIEIPYLMGLIATRSVDEQVTGIKDLIKINEQRIRNGQVAFSYLKKLRAGDTSAETREKFNAVKADLGYGLLLSVYVNPQDVSNADITKATDAQIAQAARDTIPQVAPMFWTFRIMVACGFWMLFVFVLSFIFVARRTAFHKRWWLKIALFSLPAPWLACEMGWFVAEFGRQPWAVGEMLPTSWATSSLSEASLIGSLVAFVGIYTLLAIAEMYLMVKFARKGPSSLHTGRYHGEQSESASKVSKASTVEA